MNEITKQANNTTKSQEGNLLKAYLLVNSVAAAISSRSCYRLLFTTLVVALLSQPFLTL